MKHVIFRIYFINAKIVENAGHRTAYTGVLSELNVRARFPTYFLFLILRTAR